MKDREMPPILVEKFNPNVKYHTEHTQEHDWNTFTATGLLWLVNTLLGVFGWGNAEGVDENDLGTFLDLPLILERVMRPLGQAKVLFSGNLSCIRFKLVVGVGDLTGRGRPSAAGNGDPGAN